MAIRGEHLEKRPYFIVIEGIDGSGKGTQAKKLHSDIKNGKFPSLAKRSSKLTMEPTNGMIGKLIREYLIDEKIVTKEQRALLFAADRLDNLYKNILPVLNKRGVVISERYVYSTLAYQASEDIDFDWLCELNQGAIPPDLTILLDIDPFNSIKRFKSDNGNEKRKYDKQEYFEKQSFMLRSIREKYLEIFETKIKTDNYDFFDTNFVIVDASKSIDEVYDRIKEHVNSLIMGEKPHKTSKYLTKKQYKQNYTEKTLNDFI